MPRIFLTDYTCQSIDLSCYSSVYYTAHPPRSGGSYLTAPLIWRPNSIAMEILCLFSGLPPGCPSELQTPFSIVNDVVTVSSAGTISSVSMASGGNIVNNTKGVLQLKMKPLSHWDYMEGDRRVVTMFLQQFPDTRMTLLLLFAEWANQLILVW